MRVGLVFDNILNVSILQEEQAGWKGNKPQQLFVQMNSAYLQPFRDGL